MVVAMVVAAMAMATVATVVASTVTEIKMYSSQYRAFGLLAGSPNLVKNHQKIRKTAIWGKIFSGIYSLE